MKINRLLSTWYLKAMQPPGDEEAVCDPDCQPVFQGILPSIGMHTAPCTGAVQQRVMRQRIVRYNGKLVEISGALAAMAAPGQVSLAGDVYVNASTSYVISFSQHHLTCILWSSLCTVLRVSTCFHNWRALVQVLMTYTTYCSLSGGVNDRVLNRSWRGFVRSTRKFWNLKRNTDPPISNLTGGSAHQSVSQNSVFGGYSPSGNSLNLECIQRPSMIFRTSSFSTGAIALKPILCASLEL